MSHCLCIDSDHNDRVQQLSSTTTATPTVNCSHRWSFYNSSCTHVDHSTAWYIESATTEQQCLDACVAETSCVAVDYGHSHPKRCRMHRQMRPHITAYDYMKRFEIVRPCNPTSGTWNEQVFSYRIISLDDCCYFYNCWINYSLFGGLL